MSLHRPPLVRDRHNGMLGGVCAGAARHFGVEVLWLRLALVVAVLLGFGLAAIGYVIAWMAMPNDPDDGRPDLRGRSLHRY